jgi:hypothetical protein
MCFLDLRLDFFGHRIHFFHRRALANAQECVFVSPDCRREALPVTDHSVIDLTDFVEVSVDT